jgi:PQQ-dependent catabolism-associated CXXCW motif protein
MIRTLTSLCFSLALLGVVAADSVYPEQPEAYRGDNYRALTPAGLNGARTVTTEEAADLWRSRDAAFIDVLPRPPRPENLPAGTIWREKPRRDIPGSVWLPNTGFGELNPTIEQYFSAGLDRVSHGNRAKALVFYCLRECWMSWNAAKRALALHYEHVVWYPDGTDGWASAGLPLDEAQPMPQINE